MKPLPKHETAALGQETFARVRKLAMFKAVPEAVFGDLFAAAQLERHPRDSVLFKQGGMADRFYIVCSGRVELIVATRSRRESTIDIVGPGDTVALASIFDRGHFPVGAKTVEEADLIMVPAEPFLAHLMDNFDLVLGMMASMSAHLRFLVRQVGELKLKTTGQRLGSFLLGLTDRTDGQVTVRLPYDKKLLANRLGMKPESLSRALGKLREVGVNGDHDVLVIEDVGHLRAFCQETEGPGLTGG